MKYKAILFDLDGTLIDSWPFVYQAYLKTFQFFKPHADSAHIQHFRNSSFGYDDTFKKIFGLERVDAEIDAALRKNYLSLLSGPIPLFDGVQESLNFLEQQKWVWGIVTSKKRAFATRAIECASLSQAYSCLICEEDSLHQKPHPQSLLLACSILRLAPAHVLYVGDTWVDIAAATACGMDSIAVSYGYGGVDPPIESWGAKQVIADFRQLIPFLTHF